MSFSELTNYFSNLSIYQPTISINDTNNRENLIEEYSYSNLKHLPCFSLSDRLLDFLNNYYQNHPEEKKDSSLLLYLNMQTSLHPLIHSILNFLQKPRFLGEFSPVSFSFQEILTATNPDEIEWIGSSLHEILSPYLYDLCLKHLLPKDPAYQKIFKDYLDSCFATPHVQTLLKKVGADWDLRLISEGSLDVQKEKTDRILKFLQLRSSPNLAWLSLHRFIDVLKGTKLLTKRWVAQAHAIDRYAIVGLNLKDDKPVEFICVSRLTPERVSLKKTHLSNTNSLKLFLHKTLLPDPVIEISVDPFSAQDFLIYFLGNVWNVSDRQTLDTATWLRYLRENGRSTQLELTNQIIQAIKKNYPSDENFYLHLCDSLDKEMTKNQFSLFSSFEFLFRALQSLYESNALPSTYLNQICHFLKTKRNWTLPLENNSHSLFSILFQLLCIQEIPFEQVSAALTLICVFRFSTLLSHREQKPAFHLILNQNQQEWKCWLSFNMDQIIKTFTHFDAFFILDQCIASFSFDFSLIAPYLGDQQLEINNQVLLWRENSDPQAALLGWYLSVLTINRPLAFQEIYQLFKVLPHLFPFLNQAGIQRLLYGLRNTSYTQEITLLLELKKQITQFSLKNLNIFWIKQLVQTDISHWISLGYHFTLESFCLNQSIGWVGFELFCHLHPIRAADLLKKIMPSELFTSTEKLNLFQKLVTTYKESNFIHEFIYQEFGEIAQFLINECSLTTAHLYSELFKNVISYLYQFNDQAAAGDTLLLQLTQKENLSLEDLQALWSLRLNICNLENKEKILTLWHQAYQAKLLNKLTKSFPKEWSVLIQHLIRFATSLDSKQLKWDLLDQKLRLPSSSNDLVTLLKFLSHLLIESQSPPPSIQKWMQKNQHSILNTLKTNNLLIESQNFLNTLVTLDLFQDSTDSVFSWIIQSLNPESEQQTLQLLSKKSLIDPLFQALTSLDPLDHLVFIKNYHQILHAHLIKKSLNYLAPIKNSSLSLKMVEWIEELNQKEHFSQAFNLLKIRDYSDYSERTQTQILFLLNHWTKTNEHELIQNLLSQVSLRKLFRDSDELKKYAASEVHYLLNALTTSDLERILVLLKDYQLEESVWLDCWKRVAAYRTNEWITTLWEASIQSDLLIQSQSVQTARAWIEAIQAFDLIKNQLQNTDSFNSLFDLKWLEVENLVSQKMLFYQYLISYGLSFISSSPNNQYFNEEFFSSIEKLKQYFSYQKCQTINSPHFNIYQKFKIHTHLEFVIYFSKSLSKNNLNQVISYLTEIAFYLKTNPKEFPDLSIKFYEQIEGIIHRCESYILTINPPSIQIIYCYLRLCELIISYPILSFDKSIKFLIKNHDLSTPFDHLELGYLILNQQLLFLIAAINRNDFNKASFSFLIKEYIKKTKKCNHPSLDKKLFEFLGSFTHKAGLSHQEIREIFTHYFADYLLKNPPIKEVFYVFQIIINYILDDSKLAIECLENYFRYAVTLTKQSIDQGINVEYFSDPLNLIDDYLNPSLSCLLSYETKHSDPSISTKDREHQIILYVRHFFKILTEFNYNKKWINFIITNLIEIGISNKFSLQIILPLVKELVYYVNYSNKIIFEEIRSDFLEIQPLIKQVNVCYKKERCAELINIINFVDCIQLEPNQLKSSISIDHLVDYTKQLMNFDTIAAYYDLAKILKIFKHRNLANHPQFDIAYRYLLEKTLKVQMNCLENKSNFIKTVYNILSKPPSLPTEIDYLKGLIDLQVTTSINQLKQLSEKDNDQILQTYIDVCFIAIYQSLDFFSYKKDRTQKPLSPAFIKKEFEKHSQYLYELIPILFNIELNNSFEKETINYFILQKNFKPVFVCWIEFYKKLDEIFKDLSFDSALLTILKTWIKKVEVFEENYLNKEFSNLFMTSLKELTTDLFCNSSDSYSYYYPPHFKNIVSYQTRWVRIGKLQQILKIQDAPDQIYTLQNKFLSTFTNHSDYFEQIWENVKKRGSPLQQMYIEIIHFLSFQSFAKEKFYYSNQCEKHAQSLLRLLPQTGVEGLFYLGLFSSLFTLPLAEGFNSLEKTDREQVYEKNQTEFVPQFLVIVAQLLNDEVLAQENHEIKFLYLSIFEILRQLSSLYPEVRQQQAYKTISIQLVKMLKHYSSVNVQQTQNLN